MLFRLLSQIAQNQLQIIRNQAALRKQQDQSLMTQSEILDFITQNLAPLVGQVDTNVKALLAQGSPDLTAVHDSLASVVAGLQAVVTESAPK